MMSPDDIVKTLDLIPHPEGGFYRETFRDKEGHGSRAHSTVMIRPVVIYWDPTLSAATSCISQFQKGSGKARGPWAHLRLSDARLRPGSNFPVSNSRPKAGVRRNSALKGCFRSPR
jgi:hypothetical protein